MNGRNTLKVRDDGLPCPRCAQPTEVRAHAEVTATMLRQPFYYRQWFYCSNPECPTKEIMRDEYRVYEKGGANVTLPPRSDAVMKAIRHAIDEAKLAYDFRAGSYTMSALNAVLEVERVYRRETAEPRAAEAANELVQ
jgi:hypothetical protein